MYNINIVPSKAFVKTPYELWTRKKPTIRHLHIWGCSAQARPSWPNGKKLDHITINCYSFCYVERCQGFNFLIPLLNHSLKWEMVDS